MQEILILREQTLLKRILIIFSIGLLLYMLMSQNSEKNNMLVVSEALGIGDTTPTSTPTPIPDITVPSIAITNPQNGSTVLRNTAVTIQANASDNVGVDRVEFYINSVLKCVDTSLPYTCQWFVPSKPNVVYQLSAIAFDTSGNSASHSISVRSRP